jgi:hypothetical protein
VNVTEIWVSDWLAVKLPWETYATALMVPPKSVITLSAAGRELKLAVGCPATGDPVELGAGIGNVLVVAEKPVTPSVGNTVSAGWPKNVWGSSR